MKFARVFAGPEMQVSRLGRTTRMKPKERKYRRCRPIWLALIALASFGWTGAAQPSPQPQTPAVPSPSFEVTAIRPDHLDGNHVRVSFDMHRLLATGASLKRLIEYAYNLNDFQISGGPAWANSETYAIQAKVDDRAAAEFEKLPRERLGEKRRQMMQNLLAERFNLKVSHSAKELPTYALVVAKKGPKFSKSALPNTAGEDFSSSNGQVTVKAGSMISFARWLSREVGRKVVDQTGLEGKYDFGFHWARERLTPLPDGASDGRLRTSTPFVDSGPSIFTALPEQLGLKLESQRGRVETLIIESAEKPSED